MEDAPTNTTASTRNSQHGDKESAGKPAVWKRWWFWVVVAVVVVAGIVGAVQDGQSVNVPDLNGKSYSEARSALSDAGFSNVKYVDAKGNPAMDGTVSSQSPKAGTTAKAGDEMTVTLRTEAEKQAELSKIANDSKLKDGKTVIDDLKAKDMLGAIYIDNDMEEGADRTQNVNEAIAAGTIYIVTDAKPNADGRIDLNVDTKGHYDSIQNQKEEAAALSKVPGFCSVAGEKAFPYGFDPHLFLGDTQGPTRLDDGTWTYQFSADVKNAFGAERKTTVTCTGTGENDNITVTGITAQ